MSDTRNESGAELRGLSVEERNRKVREIFDRIHARPPDPRYVGKTDDEIIASIKATREALESKTATPQVVGRQDE